MRTRCTSSSSYLWREIITRWETPKKGQRFQELKSPKLQEPEVGAQPKPEVHVQPKPEVEADPKPQTTAPVISSQPSGSPIYITIPIYISTAGKLPLTLTIGDQELSLNKVRRNGNSALGRKPPSTKAPNSHYNRLLEPPKRRTTNRHRSQLKSHIYAIKDRQDSMFKPKQWGFWIINYGI